MNSWAFIIDVAKCEGCNNCFMACKDEHVGNDWPKYTGPQPLHGHRWMRLPKHERGQFPIVDVSYRPTPCMHCEQPACAQAAPDAVIRRKDGLVLIDPVAARGRKELVSACPYGAITWNEELQSPQKCTFCAHLLDSGWTQPRCAQACATGALRAVRVDDAEISAKLSSGELRQLHPELGTRPRVYYVNLDRFDKLFLAGTIVWNSEESEECLEGAQVRLYQEGRLLAETETDNYGDFKLDGLDRSESPLELRIEAPGFAEKRVVISGLSQSVTLAPALHVSLIPALCTERFAAEQELAHSYF